jgi:hypothetical protein
MYTEINEKIYKLKEQLRTKEKLDSLCLMNMEELDRKRFNLQVLGDMLKKEEKDVTKLEGTSISSIFLDMIGKKEDKLDKEREEYLVAKIKYEECLKDIEKLEKEIIWCNNEVKDYIGVKEEYDGLLREKENLILSGSGEEGRKLRENQDRLSEINLQQKEIREAIDAGKRANNSLLDMKENLSSAKSWGVWDMMGGGLISNIAKHSAIDKASISGKNVEHYLKIFKKELSDVNQFTDFKIDISSFTKFADFFFDGFFVDWFVQSKINNSLSNVNNVYERIDIIISELNRDLDKIVQEQKIVEREIKELLER